MKALVISGGRSKGAFAGGVAQYLIEQQGKEYDMYIGTSTGSLLISHLALKKVENIIKIFSSLNQEDIFSVYPLIIQRKERISKY